MGHDVHFLERMTERANPEHQAMALALYRDPQLIRHIVTNALPILSGEVERIALALDDGGSGPHVIVTKQGKFVTCLGEGMDVGDTPVISRALLEECEAWRRRPVEGDERAHQMLTRMQDAMDLRAPSRAEVERVEAVGGLYALDFLDWVCPEEDLLPTLEQTLQRRTTRRNRLGKEYEELIRRLKRDWLGNQRMAAYGGALCALGLPQVMPLMRRELEPALPAMMLASSAQHCTPMSIMWSAWCIARYDEAVELLVRHAQLFKADHADHVLLAGGQYALPLAVYMRGLSHPQERELLRSTLRGYTDRLDALGLGPSVSAGLARTLVALEEGLDAQPLAARLKRLSELPGVQHLSWHKTFSEAEGADEQELLWTLLSWDGALIDAVCEDWLLWAYAPMMVNRPVRELFAESPRVWTPHELDQRADALLRARQTRRQRELQRGLVASKPAQGRNEACACGSGKKYKRCCGQGADD